MIPLITGNLNPSVSDINNLINEINSSLGGTGGPAAAGTLTGTTLASNVINSSLTSVGTLVALNTSGALNLDAGAITSDGAGALSVSTLSAPGGITEQGLSISGASITGARGIVIAGVGVTASVVFSVAQGATSLDAGAILSDGSGNLQVMGQQLVIGSGSYLDGQSRLYVQDVYDPTNGRRYIKNTPGANQVTIGDVDAAGAGNKIFIDAAGNLTTVTGALQSASITNDGTNTWVLGAYTASNLQAQAGTVTVTINGTPVTLLTA